MEPHHDARFRMALFVGRLVFAVSVADQSKDETVHARARFNHVRNIVAPGEAVGAFARLFRGFLGGDATLREIFQSRIVVALPKLLLFRFLEPRPGRLQLVVEHAHWLAGKMLVLRKVEIAARGDAFEFLRAERKLVENIDRGLGVVSEFVLLLPVFLQ